MRCARSAHSTLCVAAARGRAVAERHQGRTCFWQMCAALRDRRVLHDLVVCAALGRDMEDFATMRWRGHRRSNAGDFGGLGRLARKTEIVKNERCTIRYSPSNAPGQALHGTHRQIPQRRDLHTVAGRAKPVPFVKLNSGQKTKRNGFFFSPRDQAPIGSLERDGKIERD